MFTSYFDSEPLSVFMQMRKLPQQNQRSKRYVYVATFLVIIHAHKTPQSYKSLYSKQDVFIVQRFKNNIYAICTC